MRLVLVPAVTELLGDANWSFPGWRDRLLLSVLIERSHEPVEASNRDRAAS